MTKISFIPNADFKNDTLAKSLGLSHTSEELRESLINMVKASFTPNKIPKGFEVAFNNVKTLRYIVENLSAEEMAVHLVVLIHSSLKREEGLPYRIFKTIFQDMAEEELDNTLKCDNCKEGKAQIIEAFLKTLFN
jgi:hypothetical protein